MTKEEMLYMLDARAELPACFSPEERKKYADTMERAYEKVKDVDPFPSGSEVEVVNDIDLEDGEGRDSHMIGKIVVIKGNYQYEYGRTGFGATPDIFHPKVMTSSEMQARDGCVPNALSSMLEYSIITDDPYAAGAWWPHLAFKPKIIPTPALTVGKLLEMAKNKRDALIKKESEDALELLLCYLRGRKLTTEQIDTMMKVVDGSVSANEIEEKEKGQENGKERK